ncbi:MAG: molybdopterin converting factor subunit 1 [Spongiibacteraceae bacterium]
MITVRFFARIREQLATTELQWPAIATVSELVADLAHERGQAWAEALLAPQIIVAINQQVANRDSVIVDGDEVAFFPPVTGG